LKKITVYQTLKDKDYHRVESDGPFKCKWENTWLGDGYYFWQEFIELAHWWGEKHRKGEYIICQAVCDFDDTKCLDLVGEMTHIRQFQEVVNLMRKKKLIDQNTTVARIIKFLIEEIKLSIEAIRIYGINSISNTDLISSEYSKRIIFEPNKPHYFDSLPAVQFCFFEKTSLNLREYKIVFPEHYREDYEQNMVI